MINTDELQNSRQEDISKGWCPLTSYLSIYGQYGSRICWTSEGDLFFSLVLFWVYFVWLFVWWCFFQFVCGFFLVCFFVVVFSRSFFKKSYLMGQQCCCKLLFDFSSAYLYSVASGCTNIPIISCKH